MLRLGAGEAEAVAVEDVEGDALEPDVEAVVLDELLTAAPATAPTPAPTAAACMVLVALDLAVWVPRSRIMAEPAGAPAVLAVGATRVERWVATVGAAGAGLGAAAAVAGVGLEPKKPKPLGLAGVVSAGLTFTAVLAGVGAGAAAVLLDLLLEEPNEPKPEDGLLGAGAL